MTKDELRKFRECAKRAGLTDPDVVNRIGRQMDSVVRRNRSLLWSWSLRAHVAGYREVVLDDQSRADRKMIEAAVSPVAAR
jgi:hypothetical protein